MQRQPGNQLQPAGNLAKLPIDPELIEQKPELAAEYRRRAPDRIRTVYNWERITSQYEELFYQLAAGEDPTRVHSSVTEAAQHEMTGATVL